MIVGYDLGFGCFYLRTRAVSINRRCDFGQSTVEVVCGLVIFVPLILLVIDGITIYGGYSANIKLCSDAARAAASGPPNAISPGTPKSVRRLLSVMSMVRLAARK